MATEEEAAERTERLQAAGAWLRTQREARGWTGSEFARRLGILQVRVSAYERGQYEVPPSAAEKIAETIDVPLIEVRRHLGLWVPSDADLRRLERFVDPARVSDDALISELVRRYQQRSDREVVDIYPTRAQVPSGVWDRLVGEAESEIILGGYTNYFFWTERPRFAETLKAKAAAGARIRILLGDPDGEVTRRRELVENAQLTLATRINITLGELTRLGPVDGLEVRFSGANAEAHVSRSIFLFDHESLVCEHIAERLGHGSLTFHFRRAQDDGPFDQYLAHFEHLWSGGRSWQCPTG